MNESTSSETSDLRRAILDTARHLLATEGYARLSMRKIAQAIGYSATSIYLHFDGKDALFQALVEEGMDALHDALAQVQAAHADAPIACLEALCEGYVQFGLARPEYYEIMFMLHSDRMARFPPNKYRRARSNLYLFVETLEAGHAQRIWSIEQPEVAVHAIWAALHGIVSLLIAQRADHRFDPQTLIAATIAQTMQAYTRLEPAA